MNEFNFCLHYIKQIHDEVEKQVNNALRCDDLTMAQVETLLLLQKSAEKQLSLKELERGLHVAQSTAAGIASRLAQKELIETFIDAQDRRVKIIGMTTKGEQCCYIAEQNMKKIETDILSALTEAEKNILLILLTKIHQSLK